VKRTVALCLAVLAGASATACSGGADHPTTPRPSSTSPASASPKPAAPTDADRPGEATPSDIQSQSGVGGLDVRYLDDDDTVKTLKVKDFKH
jgi:hypothetical protein